MPFPARADVDAWKAAWTDKLVTVGPTPPPALARFAGKVGRVVTVNYAGRAVVDFADGAWYDIPEFAAVLVEVTDPDERKKYDATANAAQPRPARQS